MARIEEIHHRLMNWARWKHGDRTGGLGYARVQLNGVPTRSAYRESIIPTSEAEAVETDDGLRQLPTDLQRAVEQVYLQARSARRAAPLLGCSPATVLVRVDDAHRLLQHWLTERQRAGQAERARVEALQHAQRPAGEGF
jgi:hypothetical protein